MLWLKLARRILRQVYQFSGSWKRGVAVGLHTLLLLCSLAILFSAMLWSHLYFQMEEQHGLVLDSLVFPCLDLGGCCVMASQWVTYHVVLSYCLRREPGNLWHWDSWRSSWLFSPHFVSGFGSFHMVMSSVKWFYNLNFKKKSSLESLTLFHCALHNFVKPVSDILTKQKRGELLYYVYCLGIPLESILIYSVIFLLSSVIKILYFVFQSNCKFCWSWTCEINIRTMNWTFKPLW